jgi:hypothetical protein
MKLKDFLEDIIRLKDKIPEDEWNQLELRIYSHNDAWFDNESQEYKYIGGMRHGNIFSIEISLDFE